MAHLDAYYRKWDNVLKGYDSEGERRPPADLPKIDPKDISCHVGKPLTEEEFLNRNKEGTKPHVLRP
jgi:hypothetical protein